MNRPILYSTRMIADFLGVVDTDYVVGEIKAGRLPCVRRFPRPGGRTLYRIELTEFRAYCAQYCPRLLDQLPAA